LFTVASAIWQQRYDRIYRPLEVSSRLRGFADESDFPALGEKSHPQISISALAHRVCPTGRDTYIEQKLKEGPPSWARHVIGKIGERLLIDLYNQGIDCLDKELERDPGGETLDIDTIIGEARERGHAILDELMVGSIEDNRYKQYSVPEFAKLVAGDGRDLLDHTASALGQLIDHELTAMREFVASEQGVGGDWVIRLRAALLAVQFGIKIDKGTDKPTRFGLTQGINPDFLFAGAIVGDLKIDQPHPYYDTLLAGYAILAEYYYRRRVNYAALYHVGLDLTSGTCSVPGIRLVQVTDEMRRLWITQRDSAQDILRLKNEPVLPKDTRPCPTCAYNPRCWPNGIPEPVLLSGENAA
jgi:CRISPR/Cas system-associated exonuclease Cas4 (RecB family)